MFHISRPAPLAIALSCLLSSGCAISLGVGVGEGGPEWDGEDEHEDDREEDDRAELKFRGLRENYRARYKVLLANCLLTFGTYYCFDMPSVLEDQLKVYISWKFIVSAVSGFIIGPYGCCSKSHYFCKIHSVNQLFDIFSIFRRYRHMSLIYYN